MRVLQDVPRAELWVGGAFGAVAEGAGRLVCVPRDHSAAAMQTEGVRQGCGGGGFARVTFEADH